jgi:hypothetical protein
MEEKKIKLLILQNKLILLTQIEEVGADIGEPDCKLIEPFVVKKDEQSSQVTLEPWLIDYTSQNTFMMHSDKILTITDPNSKLLNLYQDLIK